MPVQPILLLIKKVGGLFIQRTAGGARYIYLDYGFKEPGKANLKGMIVLKVQSASEWKNRQSQTA